MPREAADHPIRKAAAADPPKIVGASSEGRQRGGEGERKGGRDSSSRSSGGAAAVPTVTAGAAWEGRNNDAKKHPMLPYSVYPQESTTPQHPSTGDQIT